jgi:hypothetical protein
MLMDKEVLNLVVSRACCNTALGETIGEGATGRQASERLLRETTSLEECSARLGSRVQISAREDSVMICQRNSDLESRRLASGAT